MRTFFHDIEPLYDRYGERLFRTSLRIVGDRTDAEEAMHDTLLRFARTRNVPGTAPQTEAWLVKTCVRLSIDRLRKTKRLKACTDELESPRILRAAETAETGWSDFLHDPETETSVKIERIRTGIASLAEGYRLILSLYLFEGFDSDEIAELVGIKASTVRSQYARAKTKLLEKLGNHG